MKNYNQSKCPSIRESLIMKKYAIAKKSELDLCLSACNNDEVWNM